MAFFLHKQRQKLYAYKHICNMLNNSFDEGYYWKIGEFPQHDPSLESGTLRRPRFIDHRNVHCAVGYLILKSPGFEQLPKEINLASEYCYIDEIKNENLKKWIKQYGYTLEELQMIQPRS